MAHITTVAMLDDLDGSKAVETVRFALDGADYEIDLNAKNAKVLRKALADFINAARMVRVVPVSRRTGRRERPTATRSQESRQAAAAIRAWAAQQGFEVSARGRISEEIRAGYAAAQTA